MDEAELRQLYRHGTSRDARTQSGCPGDDELLKVLTGAATRDERQALADHMARCSDCAEEYRIAAELKPWAASAATELMPESSDAPHGSETRPGAALVESWRSWLVPLSWRHAATAAALIVLAAGGVTLWRTVSPLPASDRGLGSATLSVQPADRAVLSSPPDVLAWSEVPGAERYEVILYDFEATPLWQSPSVADPRVRLPADVQQGLRPDRPYYWRIIVSAGIDRIPSDLLQFTVADRSSEPTP